MAEPAPPAVALALQGGGTHGAFTWGVLDRLLQEVAAGRLHVSAISGTSAGAFNAALTCAGLALGGPDLARRKLADFWHALSRRGLLAGNALVFNEPSPFGGFNLDWSPAAIALEAAGLVISPYTNPFYADALAPLVEQAFPGADLAALNGGAGPRLFITATDVTSNARAVFTQPGLTAAALRASACLPTEFQAVTIGGTASWDGGYLGNPALSPLVDHASDLLLVLVNPLRRTDMPPRTARAILARLNEVTFNASVVLEINAIAAVNRLLEELEAAGTPYAGRYKPVRFHAVRNDAFAASLGVVSKSSTSAGLLAALHDAGQQAAEDWVGAHLADVGVRSSFDVKAELMDRMLNGNAA